MAARADNAILTTAREKVLVVDDDAATARRVKSALKQPRRQVYVCTSAREALSVLGEMAPDLVVVSLDLPDLMGPRVIEALRQRLPGLHVVATCARPSMEIGVRAVRAGASDVLPRPPEPARLVQVADQVLTESRSRQSLANAREANRERHGFDHMLTQSPRMLRVFDQIRAVAQTDATVLILGETGTGKELVSRAIHERSRRRDRPFISVNCGAFTESLLESELFGHEKGSFTGASGRRHGVFELADGGTLFLDELGETSIGVQVNLLRVLEEMCFRRVGGHELVHVDTRILAATNVDLEQAVREHRFREDVYYRLNVFPIHLPPLRERPEDIPLLTRHFIENAASQYGIDPPTIAPDAMEAIISYRWPGNVRQLGSLCERWVIQADGGQVTFDMLPPEMRPGHHEDFAADPFLAVDDTLPLKSVLQRSTAQVERAYLHRLLQRYQGRIIPTAKAAGITRRTLYTKMKLYGLHAADYKSD